MDVRAVTKQLVDALLFDEEGAWKQEVDNLKQLTAGERSQLIQYVENRAAHCRRIPHQSGIGALWDWVKRQIANLEGE